MKKQNISWQNHWICYSLTTVVFAFLGIILGKFTIGFLVSAILQLLSGLYPSLSDEVIEVITGNASFPMMLFLLMLYIRKKEKKKIGEMYFGGNGHDLRYLMAGVLVGFALCTLSIGVALAFGALSLSFRSIDGVIIALTLLSCLIQATTEEILFRGYLLQGLKKQYSIVFCIIMSGAIFSLTHICNPGITWLAIVNIALLGVALSCFAVRWNSLDFVIGIHVMWNFTEEIIFGTPNSGIVFSNSVFKIVSEENSLFYNQRFGIEAAVQTFILWGGMLALCVCKGERKNGCIYFHK